MPEILTVFGDFETGLESVAETITVEFDFPVVMFRVRRGPYLELVASSGLDEEVALKLHEQPKVIEGGGLAGRAVRMNESLYAADVPKEAPADADENLPNLRSQMAIPLTAANEVVGVLEVCAEEAGAFWPGDLKFFEAVAAQLGMALRTWKAEAAAEKKLDATHVSAGKLIEVARALEWNTPFFAGHSERVAWVAGQLGSAVGIKGNDARLLETAALVHDIGMMGIPDTILYSKGKLDDEERKIVQMHTVFGERMAYLMPDGDDIAPIVAAHHEFIDGSGYPERLKGDEVPLLAQVIAVADVYDALTSDRPYRAAFAFGEALAQMQGRSGCFNPQVLAALVVHAPELERTLSERSRFMPGAEQDVDPDA